MATRNPTLSFKRGNWSLAVPLPFYQGNTIPEWTETPLHTWDGDRSGGWQFTPLPPSQGTICTPNPQSWGSSLRRWGSGLRRRGRYTQVGVSAFSMVHSSSTIQGEVAARLAAT